jgi:hypothetical protein
VEVASGDTFPTVPGEDQFETIGSWARKNALPFFGGIWTNESGAVFVGFTSQIDEFRNLLD